MPRLVVPILALMALLPFTAPASASERKHCGNYGVTADQQPDADGGLRAHFTFKPIDGAGIFDVTAEVSSCRTARRVVLRDIRGNRTPGFTCRTRSTGYESNRTTCNGRGKRVVRWTSGA